MKNLPVSLRFIHATSRSSHHLHLLSSATGHSCAAPRYFSSDKKPPPTAADDKKKMIEDIIKQKEEEEGGRKALTDEIHSELRSKHIPKQIR